MTLSMISMSWCWKPITAPMAYSDYYLLQPHVVKGDTIGGEDVIMTYCGLTNLGIAYSPKINQRELDLTVMTQLKKQPGTV